MGPKGRARLPPSRIFPARYGSAGASPSRSPRPGVSIPRASTVATHRAAQIPTATPISPKCGEKINTNPLPFTSAAKLETQNGVTNNRNAGQVSNSTRRLPDRVVLIKSAAPMIPLNPTDVSQSSGLGSKYRTNTTSHQMKYHQSTNRPPESPAR